MNEALNAMAETIVKLADVVRSHDRALKAHKSVPCPYCNPGHVFKDCTFVAPPKKDDDDAAAGVRV
ncbi:MAG: hypothetical protein B7733_13100 [Myxococcales bacterium FL481]|nr:MAG: hypothetical protein B7733_13100 [Myxococcales bacterium FL481]